MESVGIIIMFGRVLVVVCALLKLTPGMPSVELIIELMRANVLPNVLILLSEAADFAKINVIVIITSNLFVGEMEPPMIMHVNWTV